MGKVNYRAKSTKENVIIIAEAIDDICENDLPQIDERLKDIEENHKQLDGRVHELEVDKRSREKARAEQKERAADKYRNIKIMLLVASGIVLPLLGFLWGAAFGG